MDKVAERLTQYVLSQGTIKKEDYEIYKYGFQTGLELLLCIITSLLFAKYMGKIVECILLMLSFFSQRAYVESIHMKRFASCFLLSCGVIICGLKFLEINTMSNITMLIIVLICLYTICRLVEINSIEMESDKLGRYFLKQRRRVMYLVGSISMVFYLFNYSSGLYIIWYTEIIIFLSAMLKIIVDKVKAV